MKTLRKLKRAITLCSLGLVLGGCADDGPIGHWVGQTTQAAPGIGSTRVEVHITEVRESGSFAGTVLFGTPGALLPATDPDVGYPTGLVWDLFDGPPTFVQHFTYSLRGVYDEDENVLFGSRDPNEVWTDWCPMQTSYSEGDDRGFACVPNCGGSFDQDLQVCLLSEACDNFPGEQIDCGKLTLCDFDNACTCDPSGCLVRSKTVSTFDLVLDGDRLHGNFYELGIGSLSRQ